VTRPQVAVLSATYDHPRADPDSIVGAVREDLGEVPPGRRRRGSLCRVRRPIAETLITDTLITDTLIADTQRSTPTAQYLGS
jgi:hypothetical protein